MKEVGITGGIGSGKSTVARIFEILGYRVYYADDRAKWLMHHSLEVVQGVKELFGAEAYDSEGNLNRKKIGEIVFNDNKKLASLNGIVHPATRQDFEEWLANTPADYKRRFLLKEAAILFEAGSYSDLESVITVYAPRNTRIERVCQRDDTTRESVLARMENQWPDAEKIRLADFTIFNDSRHLLIPQVLSAARYFEQKFKD